MGGLSRVDPYELHAQKRTALGREARGCNRSTNGRVALSTQVTIALQYMYKFVSRGKYDEPLGELPPAGQRHAVRCQVQRYAVALIPVYGEGASQTATSQGDVLIGPACGGAVSTKWTARRLRNQPRPGKVYAVTPTT
jgi:hypothetical protein